MSGLRERMIRNVSASTLKPSSEAHAFEERHASEEGSVYKPKPQVSFFNASEEGESMLAEMSSIILFSQAIQENSPPSSLIHCQL